MNVCRIYEDQTKFLRLTEHESIDSWFLFPDYTLIRLYAFNNLPYQLPKYVTPFLFAYEFLR